MAKRKSLNRRLSRYSSKSSMGSGILDPDTNILEDEQPLWWKNLENNTIIGPSTEFNLYNQTNDCLDPNSQLQFTQPADEWWKVLDASDTEIPNNSKSTVTNVKNAQDANIVAGGDMVESSTSDSERETGTRKRKIPFRASSRRSRGSNAFLNALNDSKESAVSEPLKNRSRNRGNSFLSNDEVSDGKLRSRISDANEESNADQSSNTNDILKKKPSIFKKRNVHSSENIFNDILRAEIQTNHTPSKVKNKSDKTPATEKLKVSQINFVESGLPTLQCDENDFLNLSAPKAQSSILESSNVSANVFNKENEISDKNEDSRNIILKPKSKFLKRLRLEKDEFDDNSMSAKIDGNKGGKSMDSSAEKQHSLSKSLQTSVDNVVQQVPEENVTNKNFNTSSTKHNKPKSRSSKMSTEKGILPIQETPSQTLKNNALSISAKNNNGNISTDSENHTEIVKARSKFLRNTRKSLGRNAFEQVFENNKSNDISNVISENSEKNIIAEDESRNTNENNNDIENNSDSSISLKYSGSSDGNSKKTLGREQMISNEEVELRTDRINEMPSTEHRKLRKSHSHNISVSNKSTPNIKRSKRVSMSRRSVNVDDHNIMNDSEFTDKSKTKERPSNKSHEKYHSTIIDDDHTESDTNDINEIENNLELSNQVETEALQENVNTMSDENDNRSINQIRTTVTNTPAAEESFTSPVRDAEPRNMNKKNSPSKKSLVEHVPVSSENKAVDKRRSLKNAANPFFELDKEQSRRQNENSSRIQKSIASHEVSKNISNNLTKTSVLMSQRNIDDFFKKKSPKKTDQQSVLINQPGPSTSKIFTDDNRMKGIKEQIEKIKTQVMASLNTDKQRTQNMQVPLIKNKIFQKKNKTSNVIEKEFNQPASQVDKAYLVNGKVYKRPRLPRPKHWATDRLYHYLWQHMEPKCKLMTRVYSERFVQQLAEVVTLVTKRKNYKNYRDELDALMKEMARLNIIRTRNDFYDFCYDFLPYEFRMKATPILMPGCKRTIPYDPETLHKPLLDD